MFDFAYSTMFQYYCNIELFVLELKHGKNFLSPVYRRPNN